MTGDIEEGLVLDGVTRECDVNLSNATIDKPFAVAVSDKEVRLEEVGEHLEHALENVEPYVDSCAIQKAFCIVVHP